MRTVTTTRTVVVVGARPRATADRVFRDVGPGQEAALFVLGLDPTPAQQRLTEEALALAAERRFVLTAELISTPTSLRRRLEQRDEIRVAAGRREARRWKIGTGPAFSAPGA